ncbi:MAG: divalent cation transporter [Pseudomonadota bacterium]
MPDYVLAMAYASLAGIAIPIGGALASADWVVPNWLRQEVRHGVIAFGAGVLIAAIALVLVPEGMEAVSLWVALVAFAAGGAVFCMLDRAIKRTGGGGAQLMAMVMDFLPESLALGAMLSVKPKTGLLLAILMALQNLPEAFNAYREIRTSTHMRPGTILLSFAALALLGPAAALVGYFVLQPMPEVLGAIMLFAAGGILYLIVQDIVPQAPMEKTWAPPLGAVAGFGLGMLGQGLTG